MADHNTLIGGTVREIESGTVLFGGVLREIESGMTLVNGVAREIEIAPSGPPTIERVFADNSWEAIVYACQNNLVPSTWKVADSKVMTVGSVDYQIDIIGKKHDDYADGSGKAPLTFQFHECCKGGPSEDGYNMVGYSADNNIWETSEMRLTHLPGIKQMLPSVIRNAIRPVNKLTTAGLNSTKINTNGEELFLLSEIEIFGTVINSMGKEGVRYEYYANGGSTAKETNGINTEAWWERSPFRVIDPDTALFKRIFCSVDDGEAGYTYGHSYLGVAPAFCF